MSRSFFSLVSGVRFAILSSTLLLASAAFAAPTSAVAFPDVLTLPTGMASVFVVSEEVWVEEDTEYVVATTFDIRQGLPNGPRARQHFEELFTALRWVGSFHREGAIDVGHFTNDNVSVVVEIESMPHHALIALSVRVAHRDEANRD